MANETILIIDDSRDNRLFLSRYILEPNGYRVLTARDGVDGLNKTIKHQPDLLLLDLQMPRMNGVEVMKALGERDIQVPIILMTFHGSEEIIINAFRMGVKDYIIKPFTPDEILSSIESALTETRLRNERDALTNRLMQANKRLERRLRELNALAGIGRAMTALVEIEQLLCRVIEGAIFLVRGDEGRVILINPEDKTLYTQAVKETNSLRATPVSSPSRDKLARRVVNSRKALALTNQEGRIQLPNGATATLYVPLISGKQTIGAIGIASHRPNRRFTSNDRNLVGAVADYAAVALENTRLFEELEAVKEREKQEIRRMFQTYIAPPVVERVIADPASLRLGGVRQQVTTLYADIRGFTSLAEQVEPEQLISVLNGYLAAMAHTVLKHEGTMDKIMGDEVMAFFNAPSPQTNHPLRAARTALAIQQAIERHRQNSLISLNVGVGFATGEAVVGHVGTTDLMNYTVIGDSVNMAKRLQETARPGQILTNAFTYDLLKDKVVAYPLGTMPLKGKSRAEGLYELRGLL